MRLADDAPRNGETLLYRLAIRNAEIDSRTAHSTLQAAGVNCSHVLASEMLRTARRIIALLEAEDLLCPDFEKRRRHAFPDFVERSSSSKRMAEKATQRAGRGRT